MYELLKSKWVIEYEQPAREAFSDNHHESCMLIDNCKVILRYASFSKQPCWIWLVHFATCKLHNLDFTKGQFTHKYHFVTERYRNCIWDKVLDTCDAWILTRWTDPMLNLETQNMNRGGNGNRMGEREWGYIRA